MRDNTAHNAVHRLLPSSTFLAAALLIAILTLYPFEPSFTEKGGAHLLAWHRCQKFRDVISNLLLFCPFGLTGFFALRQFLFPIRASILVLSMGLSFSLAIEMLQAFDRGRDSSLNDVILNGLSTGLGLLMAHSLAERFRPIDHVEKGI
jgi:VanZ family protein